MTFINTRSNAIALNGKSYTVTPSYRRVLQVFEVCRDKLLSELDKAIICCDLLVKEEVDIKYCIDVFNTVYEHYIALPQSRGGSSEKIVDFNEDCDYIYAGFMQAYNIDLMKVADTLSWYEFIALFRGLPDNTRIKEIMSIRARKLPAPNKHNAEEIRNLLELKQCYALKGTDDNNNNFDSGIAGLFSILKERAVK